MRDGRDLYEKLFTFLDGENLGEGYDRHSQDRKAHWPTAYGLASSAEFLRYGASGEPLAKQRVHRCLTWLVANSGCATTGAPCWGLPYGRKIWEDTTAAAPNTAFSIPTSHALQALSEAAASEIFDSDERAVFRESAIKAASHFATKCFDACDDGVTFWYSTLPQHSVPVSNAIAMVAGQLQRASQFLPSNNILSSQAGRAIQYLLAHRETDVGAPAWLYFADRTPAQKQNRYNDLLHEAFVCHGLLDYKEFGGTLGSEYTYGELYESLRRFDREGMLYDFPESESSASRQGRPARVFGLGHALYVASRLEAAIGTASDGALGHSIVKQIRTRYFDGRSLYHRPDGKVVSNRVRDVSYVLLGLAQFSFGSEEVG